MYKKDAHRETKKETELADGRCTRKEKCSQGLGGHMPTFPQTFQS